MGDANSSYKKTETSILISDKRDCNNVSKDDEHHFVIIKCQSIRKI